MGGVCVQCSARGRLKKAGGLEFDVILPTDFGAHHKLEWSHRISFYRRAWLSGNLQLLCRRHNARKKVKDIAWLQLLRGSNPF